MNAEIIAVGSEMLTPTKVDTNSLYLTEQLNSLGVEVVYKCIVGDDRAMLRDTVRAAAARSAIVVVTGGLGPTEDDVTREAVAEALGRGMTYDPAIYDYIAAFFHRLGREPAENNKRQAMVIDGAEVLENDRGTAPGLWITHEPGKAVMLLPGPPRELKNMVEKQVFARWRAMLPPLVIRAAHYRVAGIGESDLDQIIGPVYSQYTNPATTVLAGVSDIDVHVRARGATAEEAEEKLALVAPRVAELLGDRVYSSNGDPLEKTVGLMLVARGEMVAVAESCTGGLLGMRLTETAGASSWFRGGYLVYATELKEALIGAPVAEPVSEATALALASAARERAGANWGVSITGIAGPDGGTEENPVGTLWIGIAGPDGVSARKFRVPGDRGRIRLYAAQTALDQLRRRLMK